MRKIFQKILPVRIFCRLYGNEDVERYHVPCNGTRIIKSDDLLIISDDLLITFDDAGRVSAHKIIPLGKRPGGTHDRKCWVICRIYFIETLICWTDRSCVCYFPPVWERGPHPKPHGGKPCFDKNITWCGARNFFVLNKCVVTLVTTARPEGHWALQHL